MIFVIFFPLVLGLGGLGGFFLRSGWMTLAQIKRVEREGQTTLGTLKKMRAVLTFRRNYYYARVSYVVDDRIYSREWPIHVPHSPRWEKEERLEVKYLPTDPEIAFLVGESAVRAVALWACVGGIWCLLIAVVLGVMAIGLDPPVLPTRYATSLLKS